MSDATTREPGTLSIAHTEASMGWGGQEIRTLTEAAGFIRRGHRALVYAAPGARIAEEAPRFGVPVVALPIGRKRWRGLRSLSRALAADPVDVVNAHSSTDAWLAALACAWLRRSGRRAPVLVRTRHVSIRVPDDFATRWLYRVATARVVATGEALRERLIHDNGLDPSRVDSVPTGIDAARFAPGSRAAARARLGLAQEASLVGIVATLRSWKGHRHLVDAMPRLAHRGARLVIVGDGPQRAALEAQVDALALRDRVTFAGQQRDVADWLAALDVFALPSYANEGVPQALLQAMFAAIPCVTTDAGAIPEIARDRETAYIVPREDPAALAAAIDHVLDHPDESAALAQWARAFVVPRYGLETMLDRMEGVFRRALVERSPVSAATPARARGSARSRFVGRADVVTRALLRRPGRRVAPSDPRRILVAHHLLLGDTLMLTPLLKKLATLYPDADIAMTVPRAFASLYAAKPYGVRALPFDPRGRTPELFAEAPFDLALVPGDNRYAWLAAAMGAQWIVAFAGDRPAIKSWRVDRLIPYPDRPAAWGDLVAGLVDGPAPSPYRTREWPAPPWAEFARPAAPYAVLHVGASSPLKQWSPERWREVARALAARGIAPVWSSGANETALAAAIDPQREFRSLAGRLDLAQLWQLLAGARVLVAPDTGVAHLGRIVGAPTVALFGPGSALLCGAGDFWRDAPYRAVTVEPFDCRDQHVLFKRDIAWVRRCGRSVAECPKHRCMPAIEVAAVRSAIDALLGGAA